MDEELPYPIADVDVRARVLVRGEWRGQVWGPVAVGDEEVEA